MIDLSIIWKAITSVQNPGPDPVLPSEEPWNPPPGVELPSGTAKIILKSLSIGIVCAGIVACNIYAKNGGFPLAVLAFVLASVIWPRVPYQKLEEANRAYSTAKAAWDSALARWKREAAHDLFIKTTDALKQARNELVDMPNERRRRLAKLEAERESRQRQRYLDRFRINRANIPGIGPTRTAMLASYGIETAYDVNRSKIIRIPGFGNVLTADLIKWRQRHEANFRFNPKEPVDPRDILAIDRDLNNRRQSLIALLQQGPTTLRRLSNEIIAARARLIPILKDSWDNLKLKFRTPEVGRSG